MRTSRRGMVLRYVLYAGVGMTLAMGATRSVVEVHADVIISGLPARPVGTSDLVVLGVVEKVERLLIPRKAWDGEDTEWAKNPRSLPSVPSTDGLRLHMTVQDVIWGKLDQKTFAFWLYDRDQDRFSVGDSVIVGVRYLPKRLGGAYWYQGDIALFRHGDVWVAGTRKFTLDEIRQMFREETDVRHLAKAADVVVIVEMMGPWQPDLEARRSENAEQIWRVPTRVERVLKGTVSADTLSFVVGGLANERPWWKGRGLPQPDHVEGPRARWEGRWLLFLKRGPVGFYPLGGANGMLKIQGDTLLIHNRVEHPYTLHAVEALVEQEVGR